MRADSLHICRPSVNTMHYTQKKGAPQTGMSSRSFTVLIMLSISFRFGHSVPTPHAPRFRPLGGTSGSLSFEVSLALWP